MAANRPPVLVSAPAASTTVQAVVITSGDAIVSKKPDIAFLSVGVESHQSTASAAQSDLANKAAKVFARTKALGVADKDTNLQPITRTWPPTWFDDGHAMPEFVAPDQAGLQAVVGWAP